MLKYYRHLTWKDIVRFCFFPFLAASGHRIGISWQTLGRSFLGRYVLIAQAGKIAQTLKPEKITEPLNIYFATMLGGHPHNVSFEILLAWALKQKGHNIYFILDDGTFPITEDHRPGVENRYKQISILSYLFGYNLINKAGFEVINTSSMVDDLDIVVDSKTMNQIVEASLLKHYKVGVLNKTLPLLEDKINMFKKSAQISYQIAVDIRKRNPNRVIMSHGIYTSWGPIFDELNRNNIPILTYGRGKKANTKKFNWNMTSDWWDVSEEWEFVKDKSLTKAQNNKIENYLKSRVTQEKDVLVYNFGDLESKEVTLERFNLDPSKTTFTLFTNVLWDAASAQREIVFENPMIWVYETIDWFIANPEKQLIIKIHPAEKVIGTNQPFTSLIKERYSIIPSNIRLIEPQEKVNSWSIYQVTDFGLVHTTTVGMELPLLGIPCIVVSSTHYRNKGFTVDVSSKEEYYELLMTLKRGKSSKLNDVKIELAKRYAYLLFERYQIPIDYFDEINPLNTTSLKINQVEELFRNPSLNLVVECIIRHKNILIND